MPAPLLVFRLGYMAFYDGVAAIANGGAYPVATGSAGEMWNFRVTNGRCYGYVRTPYNEKEQKVSGVNLSFIEPKIKQGDKIKGIDIVFIATPPNGNQVVVGWYKNATVFHKYLNQEVDSNEYGYLCEVDANNAFLLPQENRLFDVPNGSTKNKGFIGQSNVWYPSNHPDIPAVEKFVEKLRKYIANSTFPAIGSLLNMSVENLTDYIQNSNNTEPQKTRVTSTVTVYDRNPLFVALAKKLAGGKCQLCRCDAPFKNENGEPYLEAHHVKWLSDNGEDSIKNVVALCPNCHRKMHILNLPEDVVELTEIAKSQGLKTEVIKSKLETRAVTWDGFPNLVNARNKSVSSIEIDVDSLQQNEKYEYGGWESLIKKLTAKWVNENAYSKTGTIWAWGSQSFNFHHPSYSMFYAVLGMPQEFRTYLGLELKRELGECVRCDSDSVMPNTEEGWDARCHIEDSKVWEMIDPSLWQEVGF